MALSQLNAERLTYIFMNMEDAVFATKMNGELLYANPAAEKLFGFSRVNQIKLWEAIPLIEKNDALIQLFIDGIMGKKKSFRALVDYMNREGSLFHLHVSLTCEEDEDSGLFLIVVSDLTEMIKVYSAFERYTSRDIADYVLTEPDGEKQGGKSREVTVLMSDLRGFTALSTRMPSDDLVTMLNHYFEIMAAVIDRFGGTILEFLGDGLFVVFGAPKEMAEHAAKGAACAVEMQNAMAEVNEWNREKGYPALEMGIGIHSGVTVVGNIGSDRRMKYGCIGEAVNLAGRLEQLTVGGQILISETSGGMISERLQIAEEKSFMPKGAREEMTYYDLTGVGEHRMQRRGTAAEAWKDLDGGREIVFSEISGKTVDAERYDGRITRISEDEKMAMLTCGRELQALENLRIRIGEADVYAKVLGEEGDGYRICFTAKPEGLARMLMNDEKEQR